MRNLLILLGFVGGVLCNSARAAEMVNVEYIHLLIEQKWGITVPYNPALQNVKVAANMKYLLTAVDRANKILNGTSTTDYGNGAFATQYAADTVATIDAADRLIKIEPKFFVTTTADTTEFEFTMSASGVFQIYWGDGMYDIIKRTDTTNATYRHVYATSGEYTIGIGGRVAEYSISDAAIWFGGTNEQHNATVAKISGSLGAVFSTIGDGSIPGAQPRFNSVFAYCDNLTGTIPSTLFAGIKGRPVLAMFQSVFSNCINLTGEIPANLFAGIKGAPTPHIFDSAFMNCYRLTQLSQGVFSGIEGEPAEAMFQSTFNNCYQLRVELSEKMFGNLVGEPAKAMFYGTFRNCYGLIGKIPGRLFDGISGAPAVGMFSMTFYGCSGLTEIPEGLFGGIEGDAAADMFHYTFYKCTGLSKIPDGLFAGINGTPKTYMFNATFSGCSGLESIPDNLFGNISGDAVEYMFYGMFDGCAGLSGPSAKINGVPLYEIWSGANWRQVGDCYNGAVDLSDYGAIPDSWK